MKRLCDFLRAGDVDPLRFFVFVAILSGCSLFGCCSKAKADNLRVALLDVNDGQHEFQALQIVEGDQKVQRQRVVQVRQGQAVKLVRVEHNRFLNAAEIRAARLNLAQIQRQCRGWGTEFFAVDRQRRVGPVRLALILANRARVPLLFRFRR